MPDIPDSHGPPPAPAAQVPARRERGLLARLFQPVRVPRDVRKDLLELSSRGSLVFVMRAPGLLNFLYLRWFLRRHGLPPLRAAQGFPGLFGWLARVRRSRRAFEEVVRGGDASLVFLGRRADRDPISMLVRLQRDLFQPVFLVPVLLLWSRRAQRLPASLWDVLYGAPDEPNALANAIAFLRNKSRAFFDVGRPVDLQAVLRERPAEPDAVIARKVRGALHQHLAREFRTAVGPPLKAPRRVRELVMRDRSLRAIVEQAARTSGKPAAAVQTEAQRNLREIASRYDPRFVAMVRPLLGWIFSRLYEGLEIDEAGLARVKRAAAEGPIVLCPSHKSYIDFLVLPFVLYEHGMTPPHVAAGINLSFWPFGAIARRGGAFFIRRTVRGSKLYTAVLRAYVKHLLRDRFPQEFYIEGGRSRTGRLLFPKTGLCSMEVDAWLDGAADDVFFVPVAIDYENLIEASSYVRELSGGEKEKESFRGLLRAVRVLRRRYQRLYVQFGAPISVREVARARLGDRAASLTIDESWGGEAQRATPAPALERGARDAPAEAKRQLVQELANRIAYGISLAVTITPVGLVAAALLSHVRRGIAAGDVAKRVELLRYAASEAGARFARDLSGAPSDPRQPGPIADAVRRLSLEGLVRVEVAAGDTIYQVVDERRPVLDYHRNAVIHRYAAPALVAAAVWSCGGDTPEGEVRERAQWLSRLFKLEFMYQVGARFDDVFDENAAFLARVGAIEWADGRIRIGPERDLLAFLAEILRPFLEAYRLAAETALSAWGADAVRQRVPDGRPPVREALERGRAEFLAGRIALRESLSKATVENAFLWLVDQGLAGSGGAPDAAAIRVIIDRINRQLAV